MTPPLTLISLPLFPLETLLFPGGTLLLRVFEVRYLDMVRKCERTGAPFGVVALHSGQEVRQAGAAPEQLHNVGTLASIEALHAPQPGLIALRIRGLERFSIVQRSLLPHGLWVANVQHLAADMPTPIPPDLRKVSTALGQVLHTLRSQQGERALPEPSAVQLNDCGWVANRWCELLPVPLALKQQLMVLDNPLLRLELVGDVLDRTGIAP